MKAKKVEQDPIAAAINNLAEAIREHGRAMKGELFSKALLTNIKPT